MDTTVFYETLNQYKCNAGIVLEAAENDKVSAAYKCKITEITSTPEFGNVVKASLGNGYEVMYGQLKDINVSVGQVVDAGCTIGTVAVIIQKKEQICISQLPKMANLSILYH